MNKIILLSATLIASCQLGQRAEAEFEFTYTGTFDIDGVDHAQIEGGSFVLTAAFPSTPYVDKGDGQPVLFADRVAFSVTGAPATTADTNGDYFIAHDLLMFPALGGVIATLGNPLPAHFTRFVGPGDEQLRLNAQLFELHGGDGLGATIGQMPVLSHFPTSMVNPQVRALPHNILYDVVNASISTVVKSADTTPPEITGHSSVDLLWPPNHKMVGVHVEFEATDDQSLASELFDSLMVTVSSSEPDQGLSSDDPAGDVNGMDGFAQPVDVTRLFTFDDVSGLFEGTIDLRAERFDESRTYTIEAAVWDAANNAGSFDFDVVVPRRFPVAKAVPEPTTSVSFLVGIAMAACASWRKRRRSR